MINSCQTQAVFRYDLRRISRDLGSDFLQRLPFTHAQRSRTFLLRQSQQHRNLCRVQVSGGTADAQQDVMFKFCRRDFTLFIYSTSTPALALINKTILTSLSVLCMYMKPLFNPKILVFC